MVYHSVAYSYTTALIKVNSLCIIAMRPAFLLGPLVESHIFWEPSQDEQSMMDNYGELWICLVTSLCCLLRPSHFVTRRYAYLGPGSTIYFQGFGQTTISQIHEISPSMMLCSRLHFVETIHVYI